MNNSPPFEEHSPNMMFSIWNPIDFALVASCFADSCLSLAFFCLSSYPLWYYVILCFSLSSHLMTDIVHTDIFWSQNSYFTVVAAFYHVLKGSFECKFSLFIDGRWNTFLSICCNHRSSRRALSLKLFLIIDLRKWLNLADSLDISERDRRCSRHPNESRSEEVI